MRRITKSSVEIKKTLPSRALMGAETQNGSDNRQVRVPSAVRRYLHFKYYPQFLLSKISETQNHETWLPRCVDYLHLDIYFILLIFFPQIRDLPNFPMNIPMKS